MPDPILKPIGSSLWVVWKDAQVTLEVSRIAEHRDTLTAEVSITSAILGEVHWARVNLLSSTGRRDLIKAAADVLPDLDWRVIVERSCRLVSKHLRTGEPAVPLEAEAPNGRPAWLVDGLIPLGHTSILFADGGAGKSYLALALAVAAIQGYALSGRWQPHHVTRALYLDWEADQQAHAGRLWALTAAREALEPGRILYRHLYRPVTDHIDQIQSEMAKEEVDLVIVDSLGPACGPEPESNDAAVRTLMALRSLPATRLVIAHVSKQAADAPGPSRPFGGVYVTNLARSTIEARRQETAEDDGTLTINLYHRKANMGRLTAPSALAMEFDAEGRVSIRGAEVDLSRANLPTRILDALKGGSKSATDLANDLGVSPGSMRSELSRLRKRDNVVNISEAGSGRGQKGLWGLVDRKRDNEPF